MCKRSCTLTTITKIDIFGISFFLHPPGSFEAALIGEKNHKKLILVIEPDNVFSQNCTFFLILAHIFVFRKLIFTFFPFFQTMKRPGHDVEPAIVECNDPSHQHNIAVMPKSGSFGFGSTNSWTAIGVCTFLVIVFACTTLYYWQKAQKMSKDLFTDNEGMYIH